MMANLGYSAFSFFFFFFFPDQVMIGVWLLQITSCACVHTVQNERSNVDTYMWYLFKSFLFRERRDPQTCLVISSNCLWNVELSIVLAIHVAESTLGLERTIVSIANVRLYHRFPVDRFSPPSV